MKATKQKKLKVFVSLALLGLTVLTNFQVNAYEKQPQEKLPIQLVQKLRYLSKLNLNKSPQIKQKKDGAASLNQTYKLMSATGNTQNDKNKLSDNTIFYIPPYQYKILSRLKSFVHIPDENNDNSKNNNAVSRLASPSENDATIISNEDVQQARKFCQVLANGLKDQLLDAQKTRLLEIKDEIDKKMAALNFRLEEYKQVLKERDDQLKKIDDNIIAIYTKMRPETAASQLTLLDNKDAATILSKLNPKISSTILNEMDPNKAAQLTELLTTLNFTNPSEKKT